jgi:predicted Zn-dependent protease with MMP-like domain
VQTGDRSRPERPAGVRRRDRHGRGLRGVLAPPDVPLHRTRAERFDDLVLQAVARLEPRWEAHLAGVEFAVEEIPPADEAVSGAVPLARLEPGSPGGAGGPGAASRTSGTDGPGAASGTSDIAPPGQGDGRRADGSPLRGAEAGVGGVARAPRIVVYRRPLLARADGDDDLGELVFEVIVEEFARLLGMNPEDVDPGYLAGD